MSSIPNADAKNNYVHTEDNLACVSVEIVSFCNILMLFIVLFSVIVPVLTNVLFYMFI